MGKILIVDDDRSVVFMLAEVLRDAGHDVVTTLAAEEALGLLQGVDAALVDLHMPGDGGAVLVQRIHERDASLPIILLTGDARPSMHEVARSLRVVEVMTKPLDIDELVAVLHRALLPSPTPARGTAIT